MISNTTIERLKSYKIPGFVDALLMQTKELSYQHLSFDERLTLLVDTEFTRRTDVRIKNLLKIAKLPTSACLEEIDFTLQRSLNKTLILELASGSWLSSAANIIVTGATGVGKTFLACAIARNLCMLGHSIKFFRTNQFIQNLIEYSQRGSLQQAIANLCKTPLLIFDEWLLDQIHTHQARPLLDLIDMRYQRYSCLFISQLPVTSWHSQISDPTLADAILDRIVHNSCRLELSGESIRKLKPNLPSLTYF